MAARQEACYRHPEVPTAVRCTRCARPICPDCMTPAPVGHQCPTCVHEGMRDMRRRRISLPRPRGVAQTLIAINILMFVVEIAVDGLTNLSALVRLGAMVPELVARGDYWRLLASMFLHIGALHLALNMIGLYLFGSLLESVYGSAKMLAVYLVTGFVASSVSFALGSSSRIVAGASGAIFGMLGSWLVFNWRRRALSMAQANVRGALLLVAVNVVFGLSLRGIDNLAHAGGLLAGMAAGFLVEGWGRGVARRWSAWVGLFGLAAAGAFLTAWGSARLLPAN